MQPAHVQMQIAAIQRADNSSLNLYYNLSEFLLYMINENGLILQYRCHGDSHATMQMQPHTRIHEDTWKSIVCTTLCRWAARHDSEIGYDEPALLLHKKMFDVMVRDKQGIHKDIEFAAWCKRVHQHAQRADRNSNSGNQIVSMMESLAKDMLANDVTPEQREKAVYQQRYTADMHPLPISPKQRSWMKAILRKNLGDSRVAAFITNHGIPCLIDSVETSKHVNMLDAFLVLDEFMHWYASLLHHILEQQDGQKHQQQPEPRCQHKRKHSSLDRRP